MRDPELELRLDVGRLTLGCIDEREDGHVSGIPAVHGFVTNLALGVTALLERQTSRRHLIFGPAIGTFDSIFADMVLSMRSDYDNNCLPIDLIIRHGSK